MNEGGSLIKVVCWILIGDIHGVSSRVYIRGGKYSYPKYNRYKTEE